MRTCHPQLRHLLTAVIWPGVILPALIIPGAMTGKTLAGNDPLPGKTSPPPTAPDDVFGPVRVHIQKGRLAEALERLDQLAAGKKDALRIALLRTRCFTQQGNWQKAETTLQTALRTHPQQAELLAWLAEVQYRTGRYSEAEKTAEKAIRIDADQPRARLVLADVYTETGRIDRALAGYRWFVRYYNRVQPEKADTLLLVARGALQYARWKSVSQIFRFVINTLCPDALKADENCWQAYHLSGDVLLEKYNRAQALPELQRALAINPQAAPVMVSLGRAAWQKLDLTKAERYAAAALKIVPTSLPALHLQADVLLSRGHLAEAQAVLQKALQVNPHEQRTLARLAACYLLLDGPPPEKEWTDLLAHIDAVQNITINNPGRFTQLVLKLARRNPRPGYFLTVLGKKLEDRRKFSLAERCYRTAIRLMPELSEPKTALGLLYMRIGRTKEAEKILDDAFRADPFHVRVSNMRKVLKVLDGYEAITTDHFVIRVDSQADRILGQYMAEYLESIYPELTQQFGFEPPQRTQFEIYHNAKGLSAHEWFSARLIGLPWLHTIGASTGVIVAMTSPTASEKPFNWARVVKHEFVHIITLQQTKFNIPHWFTEALAVTAEGYPRTETWNRLLLQRVPKGDIRTLKNLNDGFIRPRDSLDWQFAYCQSRLYARYMTETYGKGSLRKMLQAYRNNLPTEKAVPFACGVDLKTFEKGYRAFLDKIVVELRSGDPLAGLSPEEIRRAYADKPEDDAVAGRYAYLLFSSQQRTAARAVAEKVHRRNPKEPLAAYVLARLFLLAEDRTAAVRVLEAAHHPSRPSLPVVLLLAELKQRRGQHVEAAAVLETGRKHFPHNEDVLIALARSYLQLQKNDKLKDVLERLAERHFDDVSVRKKLTELAFARQDYEEVIRQGREVLFIDVLDGETHRMLGIAYRALKKYKESVREFETATILQPRHLALQLELAKAHLAAGNREKAETVLRNILKADPAHREAKTLLQQLPPP